MGAYIREGLHSGFYGITKHHFLASDPNYLNPQLSGNACKSDSELDKTAIISVLKRMEILKEDLIKTRSWVNEVKTLPIITIAI